MFFPCVTTNFATHIGCFCFDFLSTSNSCEHLTLLSVPLQYDCEELQYLPGRIEADKTSDIYLHQLFWSLPINSRGFACCVVSWSRESSTSIMHTNLHAEINVLEQCKNLWNVKKWKKIIACWNPLETKEK